MILPKRSGLPITIQVASIQYCIIRNMENNGNFNYDGRFQGYWFRIHDSQEWDSTHLKEIKFPMKTKTTYELVTDLDLKGIARAMIDGEVFYNHNGGIEYKFESKNGYYNFYSCGASANVCTVSGDYYRKVEKPYTAKDSFKEIVPDLEAASDFEILAACNRVAEQFK